MKKWLLAVAVIVSLTNPVLGMDLKKIEEAAKVARVSTEKAKDPVVKLFLHSSAINFEVSLSLFQPQEKCVELMKALEGELEEIKTDSVDENVAKSFAEYRTATAKVDDLYRDQPLTAQGEFTNADAETKFNESIDLMVKNFETFGEKVTVYITDNAAQMNSQDMDLLQEFGAAAEKIGVE